MSGTPEGGKKAAATNRELYGEDFYTRIGKKGGKIAHPETRTFANKDFARKVGAKGGRKSRRGPIVHDTLTEEELEIVRKENNG